MSDLSVAAGAPAKRELRIDRVLGGSFSILGNRLPRYILLSALPGLPYLLAALLSLPAVRPIGWFPQAGRLTTGVADGTSLIIAGVLMLAVAGIVILAFTLTYVATIYGVFQDMRGEPFRLVEGLGRGLTRFWPLIGLWICAGLGAMVGFILLIVPGLILIVMWWVAAPACVLESRGPIQSLERSSDLTRGNRWRVFALLLVVGIGSSVIGGMINIVPTLLGAKLVAALVSYAWNTIATAFHLIVTVVTYHELRLAREGIDASSIASVFD